MQPIGTAAEPLNEQRLPPNANVIWSPSIEDLRKTALQFVHIDDRRYQRVNSEKNERLFRSNFGVGSRAIQQLIVDLQTTTIQEARIERINPKYLFLTLFWFKTYNTYDQIEGPWGLSDDTIRKYVFEYSKAIHALKEEKIQYGGFDDNEVFLFTTDGIHCKTYEVRKDPSTKWYSHKHHGPGLTYLLGITTKTQRVVWIDGPHPASSHDLTIFRRQGGLGDQVREGTRGIRDSAFSNESEKIAISHPGEREDVAKMKARLKARHETFNGRIKGYSILSDQFRHDVKGLNVMKIVSPKMRNANPNF